MKLKTLLLLFCASLSFATCDPTLQPTYTANAGLAKPAINSCSWGTVTNNNWSIVDSSFVVRGSNGGTVIHYGLDIDDPDFPSYSHVYLKHSLQTNPSLLLESSLGTASINYQNQPNVISGSNVLIGSTYGDRITNLIAPSPSNASIFQNSVYIGTYTVSGIPRFAVVGDTTTAYTFLASTSPTISTSNFHVGITTNGVLQANKGITANTITATNLTTGQCVQSSGGQLVSSGGSCGGGSGGSSSLQVTESGVQVTSPTASINFYGGDFNLSAVGSTSTVYLAPDSTNYIRNTSTQETKTLNVTSGTVNELNIGSTIVFSTNIAMMKYGDKTSILSVPGTSNLYFGYSSGISPTAGTVGNTCIGGSACALMSSGALNTAVGNGSQLFSTTGSYNASFGEISLRVVKADRNTCGGSICMSFLDDGVSNTGLGLRAGVGDSSLVTSLSTTVFANVHGSSNTFLGAYTGQNASSTSLTTNGAIAIGFGAAVDSSWSAQIGGRNGTGAEVNVRASSFTIESISSGQCLQTGTNGLITGTGSACGSGSGGGGYALQPATVTIRADQGLTATSVTASSSMTITGASGLTTPAIYISSALPTTYFGSAGLIINNPNTGAGQFYDPIRFDSGGSPGFMMGYESANGGVGGGFFWGDPTGTIYARMDNALTASMPVQVDANKNFVSSKISLSSAVVGSLQAAQFPALTGDVTTSAGSLATTAATSQGNIGTFTASSITIASASGLKVLNYTQVGGSITVTGAGGETVTYGITAGSFTANASAGINTFTSSSTVIVATVKSSSTFQINDTNGSNIMWVNNITSVATDAAFNVIASTNQGFEFQSSTSAVAPYHVRISTSGHFITNGVSPSMGSCGTSPSVVGDDNQGTITVGGGVVTSCTMNFYVTWGGTPTCQITDNSTAITGDISSISATSVTMSFSASLSGGTIFYHCGCSGTSCL